MSWKWLRLVQEAGHCIHQSRQSAVPMIASHRIVELLPQLLNVVNPRVINRLVHELELRVARQPSARYPALMDDVVIQDQMQPPCPTVGSQQDFQ